ncbi:hypothetical protein BDY21DRAFT_365139 [Lineolata rhizophorae]|uniref:glycogenin glucosyltransferase n=1 Tax=Lineolata rhizophorae TaxID=578093 RepID=A0A6A6NWP2_9PEZI|nr:hypothetical protein BDY21DRAFT_365139 [Lineolata rhizophorae]
MATAAGEDAYCTLLMSDNYLPGAAVLAHSLRDAGTTKKLAVMATLDALSADTVGVLKELYDYVIPVDRIGNPNPANLFHMDRADLLYAFTKIALWRQTQFRKLVYLDADVVVLRALDELFDLPHAFAAAPDVGWPDAFNTGVMVLTPNMGDYWALRTLAASGDSFDGADQGLLNQYFEHRNWHRLSFRYNCTPNAQYQWEPAYRYYKSNIGAVHFIGKDKPWRKGRQAVSAKGGTGVYNELLSRWWAVYDRHLKAPTTAYVPGHYAPSTTVQRYVTGESTRADFGITAFAQAPAPAPPAPQPEAAVMTTEPTFTEQGEPAENIQQGIVEPTPTAEQRRFSAPQVEWDATRSAPPAESKPEAEHFPTQQYHFTSDPEPFHAPQSYPEPPKDMWYQMPSTPRAAEAARPPPIFPWEREHDMPKPTRVFPEDLPPPPLPVVEPSPTASSAGTAPSEQLDRGSDDSTPPPNMPPKVAPGPSPEQSWQAFGQSAANAWDAVPGIERYVRAVMQAQGQRVPGPTVPPGSVGGIEAGEGGRVLSPPPRGPAGASAGRRESLILTDFPTAVERPSLPVTPAPIRRPTFWGGERDESGALPAAEGVPDQADWVGRLDFPSSSSAGFSAVAAGDDVVAALDRAAGASSSGAAAMLSAFSHTLLERGRHDEVPSFLRPVEGARGEEPAGEGAGGGSESQFGLCPRCGLVEKGDVFRRCFVEAEKRASEAVAEMDRGREAGHGTAPRAAPPAPPRPGPHPPPPEAAPAAPVPAPPSGAPSAVEPATRVFRDPPQHPPTTSTTAATTPPWSRPPPAVAPVKKSLSPATPPPQKREPFYFPSSQLPMHLRPKPKAAPAETGKEEGKEETAGQVAGASAVAPAAASNKPSTGAGEEGAASTATTTAAPPAAPEEPRPTTGPEAASPEGKAAVQPNPRELPRRRMSSSEMSGATTLAGTEWEEGAAAREKEREREREREKHEEVEKPHFTRVFPLPGDVIPYSFLRKDEREGGGKDESTAASTTAAADTTSAKSGDAEAAVATEAAATAARAARASPPAAATAGAAKEEGTGTVSSPVAVTS